MLNSLAPGRPGCHFKTAIFNLVLLIGFFRSSNDNPPRWMPWDLTDDKSTLVQVMAWCHQATSHYLSQCWPSSMSPYGITRPQWVKWNNLFWRSIHYVNSLLTLEKIFLDICQAISNAIRRMPQDFSEDKLSLSTLVQVMVRHWTYSKPLPEPMMTYFTDAYMHPQRQVC